MMNITLGQFYPGDSLLHRMDPRTKILLTVAMIVTVFLVRGFLGYVALFLYIAAAARAAKVSLKVLAKGIKPILFIILLTFFLNVFFAAGEDVIFAWKFITVSWTGVKMAIYMAPASYTHLDVYKRQAPDPADGPAVRGDAAAAPGNGRALRLLGAAAPRPQALQVKKPPRPGRARARAGAKGIYG